MRYGRRNAGKIVELTKEMGTIHIKRRRIESEVVKWATGFLTDQQVARLLVDAAWNKKKTKEVNGMIEARMDLETGGLLNNRRRRVQEESLQPNVTGTGLCNFAR